MQIYTSCSTNVTKEPKHPTAKTREPQISVSGRLGRQISVTKNNFTEIYISQRLDWAFPSLSHYPLLYWIYVHVLRLIVPWNYFGLHHSSIFIGYYYISQLVQGL